MLMYLICVIQELRDLVDQYDRAVPVEKAWLQSCFSKEQKVNTTPFLHHLKQH